MKQNRIWSQDLYQKAIRFAGEAHGDQKITGSNLPYIIHLSNVCMEIMAAITVDGAEKPDLAVQCALLHDTVEDSGVSPNELRQIFGNDVAEGVNALTKNKAMDKELRMADSIERIKLQPREIWMVKLADRITNLQQPPSSWSREKILNYRREAEYILENLGEASPFLKDRLEKKIADYC